jgi:hypothetical protein
MGVWQEFLCTMTGLLASEFLEKIKDSEREKEGGREQDYDK